MGQAARIQFHDNAGLSIRVQIQQGSRIHLHIQKARLNYSKKDLSSIGVIVNSSGELASSSHRKILILSESYDSISYFFSWLIILFTCGERPFSEDIMASLGVANWQKHNISPISLIPYAFVSRFKKTNSILSVFFSSKIPKISGSNSKKEIVKSIK